MSAALAVTNAAAPLPDPPPPGDPPRALQLAPSLKAMGLTPLMAAVLVGAAQNVFSKSSKYSLFDPCKEVGGRLGGGGWHVCRGARARGSPGGWGGRSAAGGLGACSDS